MNKEIKEKVKSIQERYAGEITEFKLYKAIEETSKAKDEEFIKILDEIVSRNFKDEYGACIYFSDIEEIKQRIKEE